MKKTNESKDAEDDGRSSRQKDDDVKPVDYLRAVRAQLRAGKQKEAFRLLQQASLQFPDDPLILSYYGCLMAIVDRKYRTGVEICKKAIVLLKKKESFEEELLYPVLYLNLGRAYVASGKKKDALDAFNKGLRHDDSNSSLLNELQSLGVRKRPPVPFLDRSNPINKYVGMILHATKSEGAGGKGRMKSRAR